MGNLFKGLSIGMTVLGSVVEALGPASEGGTGITLREFIRIALRSGLAAVGAFGASLEVGNEDVLVVLREELARLGPEERRLLGV